MGSACAVSHAQRAVPCKFVQGCASSRSGCETVLVIAKEADYDEEPVEKRATAPPSSRPPTRINRCRPRPQAFLPRGKQAAAVVELVFSASRFMLLVHTEHVLVSFALAKFAHQQPAQWTASPPTHRPKRF